MRERIGIVSTADAQAMTTGKHDHDLTFVRSGPCDWVINRAHNLDRKKTDGVIDLTAYRKARVLQSVEYLIGVHILARRNLRNRYPRNPRPRTNHTLPALRHTLNLVVSI